MTDQADQTIIIKYILDAQDTITKAKEMDAQILKIKTDLLSMSASSGASIKSLAAAMQQTAKVNFNQQIAALKAAGQPVQQITQQYNQLTKAINAAKTAAQQQANVVGQTTTQVGTAAQGATGGFTALASGIGSALGLSAVMIVRQFFQTFIQFAKEAIQSGYEFTKGLYQLNVGVNALRRAGTDITFGGVLEQLQKLKTEFGIFATKDLVVGASQFLNLNRDMGFTRDELFKLQEAIATLAVVNGRSMDEVQKTVALALSSGYTEGLQRLGVSINRVTIAEEAKAMGFADSYLALTEVQRGHATYNQILQKTAVYEKDLLEYQKTLPGAIDTTTAAITDSMAKTGESLLDVKYLWEKLKLAVVDYIAAATEAANLTPPSAETLPETIGKNILQEWKNPFFGIMTGIHYLSTIIRNWNEIKNIVRTFINEEGKALSDIFKLPAEKAAEFSATIKKLSDAFKMVFDAAKGSLLILFYRFEPIINILIDIKDKFKELGDAGSDALDKLAKKFEALMPFIQPLLTVIKGMTNILFPSATNPAPPVTPRVEPALTDEQVEAAENTAKEILDLQTQYGIDRRDMDTDLQRDLAKIEKDGAEKIEELAVEHVQKMYEINRKYGDDVVNAETQYNQDVQQAWDDYYSNLATAAERHSNKLLKIEEDYQEKLLRLREGFLLDLEDALQARDARQVLNLIRRYNLEKTQARRERDQNLKEEERNYKEQLNEFDRQRDERLKKLREEYNIRMRELAKQHRRELVAEMLAYSNKVKAEQEQTLKDKNDRYIKYAEDLHDLEVHLNDRAKALVDGFVNENNITATGLQTILDTILSYLGPEGSATLAYQDFANNMQIAIQTAIATAMSTASAFTWTGGTIGNYDVMPQTLPGYTPQPKGKSKAKGGIEVADTPTTAVFGDAGAEVALFLPLRDLLSGVSSGKSKLPNVAAGDKGKVQVEVLLGAGLEGRIIDKTLHETANVVLRSIRQ